MNRYPLRFALILTLLSAAPSWSQQPASPAGPTTAPPPAPPAREVPRPDQLEPGVDTSATPPSSATFGSDTAAQPASASTPVSPPPKKTSKARDAVAQPSPDANTSSGGAQASAATQTKTGSGKAQDRIELDATQITGNRELPKVLYIVPWKRSDLGDLVGKPPNSLLDEVLAPVDRDVFKRENRYYNALKPDTGAAGAGTPGAGTPAAGTAAPASAPEAAPQSGGKP